MMLPFDRQLEHATPLPNHIVATHAVQCAKWVLPLIRTVCNLDSLGYRSIIYQSVMWREFIGPVKNVCITTYFTLY
jgi:hypothetical protein